MSNFCVETEQIQILMQNLTNVENSLAAQSVLITKAYNRLSGLKGNGITVVCNRIVSAGKEYDVQWNRVIKIHSFLNNVVEEISAAEQNALDKFISEELKDVQLETKDISEDTAELDPKEQTHILYSDIVREYVEGKIQRYIDSLSVENSASENFLGWVGWFWNDLYGDLDKFKTTIEDWYREWKGKKIELLNEGVTQFFDTLSDCEILVDIAQSIKDFWTTGDGWKAYADIATKLLEKTVSEIDKGLDKLSGIEYVGVGKVQKGILMKTIVKMPQKWLNAIRDYAENGVGTAGSIVVDSTIGTFVEVVASAVEPYYKTATGLTYPIVDFMSECVGKGLSKGYEQLTGKGGLEAVFAAQQKLWVDIVYDGAKQQMSQAVDGFYHVVSEGWDNWKAGIRVIFGG